MLTQDSLNWLKSENFHDDTPAKKPKFVKMYGKNNKGIWYKIVNNTKDGTEIVVPATQNEISIWKLK